MSATTEGRARPESPPFDGSIPFFAQEPASAFYSGTGTCMAARRARSGVVLFAWELGGGLGHLMQMLPLARSLARDGHIVGVALRELDGATPIFGRAGVSFFQAPRSADRIRYTKPLTFTQLLCNVGFGSDGELFARACAWRNLLRLLRPHLIVFDHAPTALLASRGLDCRRALIGSGFCSPPDDGTCPWAPMRAVAADGADPTALTVEEARMLDRLNRVLAGWKQPPLDRIGQMYSDVDETFLTTFPELDHFGARRGAAYWGPVIGGGGDRPQWPDHTGRRVFAYLKPYPGLKNVLELLGDAGCSILAYVQGAGPELMAMEGPALRFARHRVDVTAAARECDLAVLNAGHGATAEVLLTGKPVVQIPLAREQRLIADAVQRMGAGLRVPAGQPDAVRPALEALLSDSHFTDAARTFAERYAAFDPERQRDAMLARAEELLCESLSLV